MMGRHLLLFQSIDFIISIDAIYRSDHADIKLKDLRYLVAVADPRHFGRAAERCFVSQPTLSAQLKKLEEYLGVQLIERQPNNVSLTEAGEEIVARARRILEASDEVVTLARTHRDPLAGRLRVALLPTIGPYLLPRVAPAIRKALPRLRAAALRVPDRADAREAARAARSMSASSRCRWSSRGSRRASCIASRSCVAVPERHPLAARETRCAWRICKDETLLLLEDGHCLRDQALEVCSRVGVREKQDFRATSLETLRQMVATGAGVTLLPELASRGAYRSGRGVAMRPFARPAPARHIGAVWRKTSARRAAIDAVCELIATARAVSAPPGPAAHHARRRAMVARWAACCSRPPPRAALCASTAPPGFKHQFYLKFAIYCVLRGYHALLYDYRGIGVSAYTPFAAENARMSEWGRLDMPAALASLALRYPQLPLVTLGHSVGGQLIGCMPNQARARAHVMIATSTGYWRRQRAPFRYQALALWKLYGPSMLHRHGYVPRGVLWSGESLPRGVFLQWRRWCLSAARFRLGAR